MLGRGRGLERGHEDFLARISNTSSATCPCPAAPAEQRSARSEGQYSATPRRLKRGLPTETRIWLPKRSIEVALVPHRLPVPGPEAPGRNAGQGERDQRVVASERKAEEAPGGLVAAHHAHAVELLEQVAARRIEGARTFLRARPPLPFDARVIGREPGIPEHADGDHKQAGEQDLA